MQTKKKRKPSRRAIRVGVVGVSRGMSFARGAKHGGMKLVAICDTWEERLQHAADQLKVKTYNNFDEFLGHDMDAVVLANYFHEHAPFAIKALNAGYHVLSECIACATMGEAVDLVEAVEKSGKIYFFAENYPFMAYIQEMRRLYQKDEIGEVRFAECEYMHPIDSEGLNYLSPGLNHWRNWIPSTYYPTHALGPVMYITDRRPVAVNARSIPHSDQDKENLHCKRGDQGSVIMCTMDNEAVVNVNGLTMRGHGNWYRLHGTRGLMENLRTCGNHGQLRILHEHFDMKRGDVIEKIYTPEFPIYAAQAKKAGHGGGDFFTNYFFAKAIRNNVQPWFDIYRGLDMSMVAIQAWKSVLAEGAPFEIPDFRVKKNRKKYRGEMWSPFPSHKGLAKNQPPPSIKGLNEPSKKQKAASRRIWDAMEYHGE